MGYNLLANITNGIRYLQEDFISVNVNPIGLCSFIINLLIVAVLILIFYLIGGKISAIFFKKNNIPLHIFVSIALGYILVGSGILLLGMLSIFYKQIVYAYLIILVIVAIYPITTLAKRLDFIPVIFNEYCKQFSKYRWINIAILGFILINFLRLIPPETGVDALWYHTDYPRYYLEKHSMMGIDPKGQYYPSVTPTLSDMLYVITESIYVKEASRFIHFGFYLIVVLIYLTVFIKKYSFSPYAALLFVTSPVVIRHASTAYAEFYWIACWLLAVFIVTTKKISLKHMVIVGILFGGALATKLWIIPFYFVFIAYLIIRNISKRKKYVIKLITVFSACSLAVSSLWYLRSYLVTGNPLFPMFWNYANGEGNIPSIFYFDLQSIILRVKGLISISPLSIFGFLFLIFPLLKPKSIKDKIKGYYIFGIILVVWQFIINYTWHRFIVPFYSVIAVLLAYGISIFLKVNKYFKYAFGFLYCIIFLYYFVNVMLILPYGLGWANKNKYLTRVLSKDSSSYFDYDNIFSKKITANDKVATYGLWGFYYANFNYFYAEDVFRKEGKSLTILIDKGATKLLIRGGDINWLCTFLKLDNCTKDRYQFLASYSFENTFPPQYLYSLKKM